MNARSPESRECYRESLGARDDIGAVLAEQALRTSRAHLGNRADAVLRVLDVGCGRGHTARAFADRVAEVVAIEPDPELFAHANALDRPSNLSIVNMDFRDFDDAAGFDLVVLDNVYEHMSDHLAALRKIRSVLKPDGVAYIVVPNRLWPIEVHYRLPFLSYLPLPLANSYLRLTKRGTDYRDCSYAPTVWSIRREFSMVEGLRYVYELPADMSLTQTGGSALMRIGAALIRRWPVFWTISKALVLIVRRAPVTGSG